MRKVKRWRACSKKQRGHNFIPLAKTLEINLPHLSPLLWDLGCETLALHFVRKTGWRKANAPPPSLLPRESTGGCDEGAKSGNSVESRPSETATQERSLYVSVWVLLAGEWAGEVTFCAIRKPMSNGDDVSSRLCLSRWYRTKISSYILHCCMYNKHLGTQWVSDLCSLLFTP